ncbi:hypothetical protein VTK26DRAFT_7744 [Humicola hyalothermophila]
MRLSAIIASLALLAPFAAASKKKKGPEVYSTHNQINECEMHQAIQCLQDKLCSKGDIPEHGRARCTIGCSVAYVCDYRSKTDKEHGCDVQDVYKAWNQIRQAKNSPTGWVHDGEFTWGFDRRCKDNECDNGWKKGSEGEQCTNMRDKNAGWLLDFEADEYEGYRGQWEQNLLGLGDKSKPLGWPTWQEGKRPQ